MIINQCNLPLHILLSAERNIGQNWKEAVLSQKKLFVYLFIYFWWRIKCRMVVLCTPMEGCMEVWILNI
ncbi:hypothetical protein RchiOBHm_Chr5g0047371 [Rosa chinensis]|uniref:Uncharacterized protein n=1 Tax=Rosa chinensis TaxID=74649 RepID=A0A2P6QED4_ROSCH|nr:hypothetical protein RchiOBHm_Chr5g0047371 [Rosa chinensis]